VWMWRARRAEKIAGRANECSRWTRDDNRHELVECDVEGREGVGLTSIVKPRKKTGARAEDYPDMIHVQKAAAPVVVHASKRVKRAADGKTQGHEAEVGVRHGEVVHVGITRGVSLPLVPKHLIDNGEEREEKTPTGWSVVQYVSGSGMLSKVSATRHPSYLTHHNVRPKRLEWSSHEKCARQQCVCVCACVCVCVCACVCVCMREQCTQSQASNVP
jgi:hypothetical protein